MKKGTSILIGVVVLVVGLVLGKNLIARAAVISGIKAMTGLRLQIRNLDVGFGNTVVGINGLKVLNPDGFHDPVMIDVPEVFVDYDLASILKGKPHLQVVRLNLREMTVVRNERGEVNLNALKAVNKTKEQAAAPTKPSEQRPAANAPPLQVDVLELTIGRVIYKDYSQGATPQVREFPINIHERFEHISNPYAFAGLIVTRALAKTSIARLANFDVGALQAGVTELLKGQTQALTSTVTDATQAAEALTRGVGGSAQNAVQETGNLLKKILPFDQGGQPEERR